MLLDEAGDVIKEGGPQVDTLEGPHAPGSGETEFTPEDGYHWPAMSQNYPTEGSAGAAVFDAEQGKANCGFGTTTVASCTLGRVTRTGTNSAELVIRGLRSDGTLYSTKLFPLQRSGCGGCAYPTEEGVAASDEEIADAGIAEAVRDPAVQNGQVIHPALQAPGNPGKLGVDHTPPADPLSDPALADQVSSILDGTAQSSDPNGANYVDPAQAPLLQKLADGVTTADGTNPVQEETPLTAEDIAAELRSEEEPFTGPAGPACIESWWESAYPEGMTGIWDARSAALTGSGLFAWLCDWGVPQSGAAPTWVIPLDLGIANFGSGDVSLPAWLWPVLKAILLVSTIFGARRIIFGG
jgi:hypothetical protein